MTNTNRDALRTAYNRAYDAHSAAARELGAATLAYRAGKISDADFLAARQAERAAADAFDAAHAVYAPLVEAVEAVDAEPVEVNLAFQF